ncbi:dihydrodipicolinate synthase family protein [Saccharothrix sp. Mg75]|uniref:dihydrodipicolinate synthase family protein n=1 Tax=Saccharothrix sp. Mg75 TaxID=3445357 RepID=UPI003EE9EABA
MGLFGNAGRWEGVIGCLLTPYDALGGVDAETHAAQVDFLLGSKVPALCALMHVGESLNLSFAERRRVTALTVEAAAGRAPVAVHVSCAGTAHTVELARHAESVGASAVVVTAPYHWLPGDRGLLDHFDAVARAVDIAVLAYSPAPSMGPPLSPGLVAELARRHEHFLGLKEASGLMGAFAEYVRVVRGVRSDFSVLGGVEYALPQHVLGGAGCFSICAVIAPRLVTGLWEATVAGDHERAGVLQARAARLLSLLVPGYPAGLKAAAEIMGRPCGPTRLPIPELTAGEKDALAAALAAEGVLDQEPHGWDPFVGTDGVRSDGGGDAPRDRTGQAPP